MKKKKKKQKKQSLSRVAKSDGLNGSNTDLPALEDYFNNLDENNRLQHAKERCSQPLDSKLMCICLRAKSRLRLCIFIMMRD